MALRITVAGADNWNEISNISMKSGYEDYINKVGSTYLDDGIVLLSYIDETASGFLKLEEMPDNSAWLSGIRVLPEFRRMHIGSNLTEKAIELARSQGLIIARMLSICQICGNPAEYSCDSCHGFVCRSHMGQNHLCVSCNEKFKGRNIDKTVKRMS